MRSETEFMAGIIEAQFPDLAPARVRYLGEGYDSTAFEVNQDLVFRFPKRPDVEQQLMLEAQLLPLLREQCPLPIPDFSYHGAPSLFFPRRFAGYPKLGGTLAIHLAVAAPALAPALGGFLGFLHSHSADSFPGIPIPEHDPVGFLEEIRAEALSDFDQLAREAPDLVPGRVRWFFERGVPMPADGEVVLVHGDLAAEHILVDPEANRISGVIDWSEVSYNDPAIDLAGMAHWGGPTLLREVLSHYSRPVDVGLQTRARFMAVCRGVADIVFGLERNRPEYIAAGQRAIQSSTG